MTSVTLRGPRAAPCRGRSSRLYAEVGRPGGDSLGFPERGAATGGANGGGNGETGGGGASDMRAVPAGADGSLASRLVVAGGGGGAGIMSVALTRGRTTYAAGHGPTLTVRRKVKPGAYTLRSGRSSWPAIVT